MSIQTQTITQFYPQDPWGHPELKIYWLHLNWIEGLCSHGQEKAGFIGSPRGSGLISKSASINGDGSTNIVMSPQLLPRIIFEDSPVPTHHKQSGVVTFVINGGRGRKTRKQSPAYQPDRAHAQKRPRQRGRKNKTTLVQTVGKRGAFGWALSQEAFFNLKN